MFPAAHVCELEIHVLNFVQPRVLFCGRNCGWIVVDPDGASRPQSACGERENSAPRSKIDNRPARIPLLCKPLEQFERHRRGRVFAGAKRGSGRNNKERRLPSRRFTIVGALESAAP
jgi:hypothetical protein